MIAGEYKLAKHRDGRMLYARVKVTVSEGEPTVVVEDDAFGWLSEVYGASALPFPDLGDFRGGARVGAGYALRHRTSFGRLQQVRVTEIDFTNVDTTRSAVAFAACFAVWHALGDPGSNHPAPDQQWPTDGLTPGLEP